MGQIRDLQRRTWRNKIAKKFNTTNVDREFNSTYAELAEAFEAYCKGDMVELSHELADVSLFIMGLAEMTEIDLETAIIEKMVINENRVYIEKDGRLVKKEQL